MLGIEGIGQPLFFLLVAMTFSVIICVGMIKLHQTSTDKVFNSSREPRQPRNIQPDTDIFGLYPAGE